MSDEILALERPGFGSFNEDPDIPKIRKDVISLALPSIGEFILHMTIGIVDLAFVGQLGAQATASSGLAWQLIWFIDMAFFGIGAGTTALMTRHIGAGRNKEAQRVAGQSLILSLIFSFIGSMILIVFAKSFFKLLGAEAEIVGMGSSYLRILASTFMCGSLTMMVSTCLKSAGDTRTPMYISGAMVLLNIFLDYAMIFGKFGFPAHGILGSAESSALIILVAAAISVGGLFLGWFRIKITPDDFARLDWGIISKIVKIGAPVSLEHIFWSAASAFIVWVVAASGTVHLAVHNILLKAESLSFMPGMGFSIAARVAVGQALGREDEKGARVCADESIKLGMILMGTMGLVFLFFPHAVIGFFTKDPQVLALGSRILRILGIIQPIQALLFIVMGSLKGAGDTQTSMWIGLAGIFLVRAPFSYIFGLTMGMGALGAWGLGMSMDIAFRAFISYRRFQGNKWMRTLSV